jgi:ABC-type Mn2+/Zn2+ transport system permease subunit
MTAVVATYLFGEPNIALGRFIPFWVACIIGGTFALISFGVYLFYLFFHKNRHIIED